MKLLLILLMLATLTAIGCTPSAESNPSEKANSDSSSSVSTNRSDSDSARIFRDGISRSRGSTRVEKSPVPLDQSSEPINADYDSTTNFLSWNVESDGANSDVIAAQLQELNPDDRYGVVALTEVLPRDLEKYQMALGSHYQSANTKSGNNDRIQLLFNTNIFEAVRVLELDEININRRYRAPLVVHLRRLAEPDNGAAAEMMVMVNHLARGKADIRQRQAAMLVDWAREQTLPIIALGDYNFDFVFETRKGDPAFAKMLDDNIWQWVEPNELIDTNWYDNPDSADGKDDYPGSMLDFAFVAGPAKDFNLSCNVIVREGDFPDDKTTSDHRPYELLIAK